MSEQEATRQLLEDNSKIKCRAFDELRYLVRGDISLHVCGYKTLADAAERIIQRAMKDLEKREKAFLRQYPD